MDRPWREQKKVLCVGFAVASVCLLLRIWVRTYWPLLSLTLIAGIFLVPTGVARQSCWENGSHQRKCRSLSDCTDLRRGWERPSALRRKSVPERKSGVSGHCRFTAAAVGAWLLSGELAAPGAVNGSAPAVRGMPSVLRSRNLWKVAVCAFIASGVSLVLNTYLTRALTFKGALPSAAAAIGTILNLSMIAGGVLGGGLTAKSRPV